MAVSRRAICSRHPALHRLRRDGLIEADWGVSENNQRARFYRLTPAGKEKTDRRRVAMEAVRKNDDESASRAGVAYAELLVAMAAAKP